MEPSLTLRRAGVPLVLAIVGAVAFSGVGLVYAAATGNRMAVPGAAIATSLYVILGYLAIRGADWARWTFFCLILLTTLTCLLFTFVDLGGGGKPRLDFTPTLAAVTLFYALIAVATAIPRPEMQANPPTQRTGG